VQDDAIFAFCGELDDSAACDLLYNKDVGNRNSIALKITNEPPAILSDGADKADGSPCASDGGGLICPFPTSAALKFCG